MTARKAITNYLVGERKMSIIREGKSPYYLYVLGDKSEEYDKNSYAISVWCPKFPAMVEIREQIEGKYYFQGHIYDIDDLKHILYLIFDCIDKVGYVEKKKNKNFILNKVK